jgi:hypothetical protein
MSQTKVFQLTSPVPFPITIRLISSAAGFPKVVMLPAGPMSIPVAYPGMTMQLQVRMPNGQWSPTQMLPWKPGNMALPKLF